MCCTYRSLHQALKEAHLQACGNASTEILRCLQVSAVLMHDEGPEALQLIELCLLQNLPASIHIGWQHTDAIAQEVEDQPKVLRVPVNEDAPLCSHTAEE